MSIVPRFRSVWPMVNATVSRRSEQGQKLCMILSSGIGLVMLYSGIVHAVQPFYFMQSIAAYQLVPRWTIGLLGAVAPGVQLVLGISILFSVVPRAALACASLLFAVFAIAQATVLWRGIEIDCGCFGFSSSKVSFYSLAIPLSMFAVCMLILLERYRLRPGSSLSTDES